MDSPEHTARMARRISGGPHDGEGPELNLWPVGGRQRRRYHGWLAGIAGTFWFADGMYQLATTRTTYGIFATALGALWILSAVFEHRIRRTPSPRGASLPSATPDRAPATEDQRAER